MTVEPTAEDMDLAREGAMTVKQAAKHSGFSRRELFHLMADGTLLWFRYGRDRMVLRAPLDRYIAGLIAADRAEKAAGVSQPRRVGKCRD